MRSIIVLIAVLFFLHFAKPAFAADVVINELVAHPSTGNEEWVEFYNQNNIDLTTYWLDDDTNFSDDSGNSNKKSLENIVGTNLYPYIEFSSFLNNSGDYVVLFSADGTIVDQYQYTQDPGADIPLGHYPDGQGSIMILSSATKGLTNSESPTATPTLTPTSTPIPTATNTPTPTPVATSTKTPTPTPTKIPIFTQKPNTPTPKISIFSTVSPIPSEEVFPTSILGESTKSADVTGVGSLPMQSDLKSTSNETGKRGTIIFKIFIAIGTIILIACGILFFRSYIKTRKEEV